MLQQAEFVFLDDNGGRIPVRDFDNDGIASFKTSSNLMNGVYTLNQVILSDFNDSSNSANYFANEITAFGPPGSTPPQGTNLGLITKNEFSYSNHNFDLGKYAIKIVGGQEARTDFTPPELISVTIDNPAITPGQQVSVKYNANDDSPINNVYFRFVNDAGDQITLRDTDDDGVATFDVSALNMNGSYTLQEASFTDVANNYSTYKAVGGHSGPPPPPGMPINNDPKLNLETSTGWPNKEFSSHNFNFSQFTLEMSGGIAAQTDFTHPELVTLETVATVNQGAAGTINYTPSEDLEIASFVFKNDAGKSLHFEDRENDGIARVSKNQTDTAGTYKLSQIWMRDLNKVQNSARYDEGNELELFSRQIFTETTHEVDFSNYTVNVVEWGGISETDIPTFASAAMKNAVISFREFGEINYVADGTGSSLESVEFHFTSPSGERVSFWDYDGDGVATALLTNYTMKNETFSLERVQLLDEGGNTLQLMGGNQPVLEFTVTGANPVSADTTVPTFASAALAKTVANKGEHFSVNYVADGTGSRLKNVEFVFKDVNQKQIYLRDQDDDGIATSIIAGNDLYNGTFTLDRINLMDEGDNRSNITGNDLPDLEFTLTGAQIPTSTETTKPTFTSAALEKTDFNKGEYININYVADGTGSPIKQVYFDLRHVETGHQFRVSDNDNDGVATALLSSNNLREGAYNVSQIGVEDEANNVTTIFSNEVPNLEFNVTIPASLSDPQTDFEPPELIEIDFTEEII